MARGDHLVRVSGRRDATFDVLRDAAMDARPATPEELDKMLPPGPSDSDGAPDNHVGPGG